MAETKTVHCGFMGKGMSMVTRPSWSGMSRLPNGGIYATWDQSWLWLPFPPPQIRDEPRDSGLVKKEVGPHEHKPRARHGGSSALDGGCRRFAFFRQSPSEADDPPRLASCLLFLALFFFCQWEAGKPKADAAGATGRAGPAAISRPAAAGAEVPRAAANHPLRAA